MVTAGADGREGYDEWKSKMLTSMENRVVSAATGSGASSSLSGDNEGATAGGAG